MARSAHSLLRRRAVTVTLLARFAWGLAALAPLACGLNRVGLEKSGMAPDGGPADAIFIFATGGSTGAGGQGAGGDGGNATGGAGGGGATGAGGSGTQGGGGGAPGAGGMTGAGGRGMGGSGNCPPCTPCERCGLNGTCALDPESHWDLSAISAMVDPIDARHEAGATTDWDTDGEPLGLGLPDPFCELDVLSETSLVTIGQTLSITDTTTPNWGALAPATGALLNPPTAPIRAGDLMTGGLPWLLSVGDDDAGMGLAAGETMCQIGGPLDAATFRAGGFTRTNIDSCLSVSFKLTCRP